MHERDDLPAVFLDTSALFAGIYSDRGGARQLLRLGEHSLIQLWIGRRVLAEIDSVLQRKAPDLKGDLALLLDRTQLRIAPDPSPSDTRIAARHIAYRPDAWVLAEALGSTAAYFVTLDRQHFLDHDARPDLPIEIGTPGDCLAWLRNQWSEAGRSYPS